MALSQKKRFSFFGSPPMSPTLPPAKNTTLLSNYFSSQEKQDDKLPSADDVRKAKDNFERLAAAAEAYRDLANKLSKATKVLSKALRDYGNSKGMENVYVMCLQTTSQFYDNHTEIQSKLNKALQKDFDLIQKYWDKYSKKVTKDERAHNEYVGDLDKQIKKMTKDYEKKAKKDNKASLESHNQYMNSVTAIGSDISRAQKEYAEKVAKREKRTHSIISQVVCKIAEGQFAYFNDSLKKCGPTVTKMKEWAPFAGEDMPPPQDLDLFLEDQTSQLQSDKSSDKNSTTSNSTTSERKTMSIASISEKQIAAMNISQEFKLSFNEESEDIIPTNDNNFIQTKYAQVPEPKFPVITSSETTKPTYTRPRSLILNDININNNIIKNDENTNNSTPTSSASSTPIVQQPIRPFDTKPLDLISKFSIGIHDSDDVFLRQEKVTEVHLPEIVMESRIEKKSFNNKNKEEEEEEETSSSSSDESQNDVMNDVKKENKEKKSNDNDKMDDKKDDKKDDKRDNKQDDKKDDDDKKDIKVQNENQSEKKDGFKLMTVSPLENIIHNRNNISDGSNITLNDDKKSNEKQNKIETKKEEPSPFEKSNENNETTKLKFKPNNDDEKEIINEKRPSIDKNIKSNLNVKPVKQSSPRVLSESPKYIPGEFPLKNQEILSNNLSSRSSMQVSRQIEYSQNDDYRNEYSREDTELYDNEIRTNEMNRYTNGDMIRRDESSLYDPPIRGERTRYNDTNLNYRRTQQYVDDDDDYESFDYIPSQSHGPYVTRDRSPPPRTNLPYSQKPHSNSIPIPLGHSSSVREMTNRFQSMNEERRPISPSTRNVPMQTPGRVIEMTSRFGERRKRDDPPPRTSNTRGGGDYGYDNRYNEQIEYRNDRYVQYDDLHDHDRHCNCHSCRPDVENSIHRLPSRPFNPRTDSNFMRHYNRH